MPIGLKLNKTQATAVEVKKAVKSAKAPAEVAGRRGRGPNVDPNKLMKTAKLVTTGDSTGNLTVSFNDSDGQRVEATIAITITKKGKLVVSEPTLKRVTSS